MTCLECLLPIYSGEAEKKRLHLSASIKREAKYYTGLPRLREASLENESVGSEE